jgi:hypothetical protein
MTSYQFNDSTTNWIITAKTIQPKSGETLTLSSQLILPNTASSATFLTGILTCNFNDLSTGIFSATLTANMTGITFSGGRIGGQYVIYVSASGATRTIAPTLTGTTNKTNYTTAVSLLTTSAGLITVTYDGVRYLIAATAYN